MTLIVQKFGGTSMADVDTIGIVADIVAATRRDHDVVVVVSAMSGQTNYLVDLARSLQSVPDLREMDVLLSTGEQVSMALLAMALKARGVDAQSFTGGQVKVSTDQVHGKARITSIGDTAIRNVLAQGKVAVVAGFQGVDQDGNITTLGRGGSDTSAVALAAVLHAQECQIYTDVDGVYTTDPRIEPNARRLAKITFEEMLEMASLGAKVLQIRSVEFAGKYKVPLRVLSTFKQGPGTLITLEDQQMEQALISGIAFNRDEAKITIMGVPDRPGVAFSILGKVADNNVEVDIIIQNTGVDGLTDFTFTVHRNDFRQTMDLLQPVVKELQARELNGDDRIVKVSLVGVGMRSHAGIAATMFKTLSDEGINVEMISTSEIKISVVVNEKYLELAVRALHRQFDLDQEPPD
ncbi:MAG: aspartate kinase [Gammaproteobacteria bacterium]|nr:MAG: aspartate kinase [Gammaproteobacteria bacterium]RLA14920.1 MAG: aspartate kinase [Gammaproteobacteria bacterium]